MLEIETVERNIIKCKLISGFNWFSSFRIQLHIEIKNKKKTTEIKLKKPHIDIKQGTSKTHTED